MFRMRSLLHGRNEPDCQVVGFSLWYLESFDFCFQAGCKWMGKVGNSPLEDMLGQQVYRPSIQEY